MSLDELNVGDKALVKFINCDSALKNRLYSFGVVKGSTVDVEEVTLAKNTMKVKINQTQIALRMCEAAAIGVEHA